MGLARNQLAASALIRFLGISSAGIDNLEGADLKTVYQSITRRTPSEEILKWLSLAEEIPIDSFKSSFPAPVVSLNQELVSKSVVLGNGFNPSEIDAVLFAVVHSYANSIPSNKRAELSSLMRWMSYIQEKVDFGENFSKLVIDKPSFDFDSPLKFLSSRQLSSSNPKKETDSLDKKSENSEKKKETKEVVKKSDESSANKTDSKGSSNKADNESKNADKDTELSVSLLNIQVGLIRKAWKHPSADSLLVEEIDIGEAKMRQVVSGLAKYCNPDQLTSRPVVLITNVKPGKLRDVMSEGLVLCASNDDHSTVEPLIPPQNAKIGERVTFSGFDGKPEDVLNPKKKQLEKITPNLFTDANGVATFKGIPFMTSAGPCTSSLFKAPIK